MCIYHLSQHSCNHAYSIMQASIGWWKSHCAVHNDIAISEVKKAYRARMV